MFRDIADCLADCDAHVIFLMALMRHGDVARAREHIRHLLGPSEDAWKLLNPALGLQIMILVEVALKTLAWLEVRMSPPLQNPAGQPHSRVERLMATEHRPMGHWFTEVCDASKCKDLKELSDALLRQKATHHGRPIQYDLLKKWSAYSQVAMPQVALKKVLQAVQLKDRAETLESRFYVARLLTFLCDVTRSATAGLAPTWAAIQAQIKSRHTEVYRLEVERLFKTPA